MKYLESFYFESLFLAFVFFQFETWSGSMHFRLYNLQQPSGVCLGRARSQRTTSWHRMPDLRWCCCQRCVHGMGRWHECLPWFRSSGTCQNCCHRGCLLQHSFGARKGQGRAFYSPKFSGQSEKTGSHELHGCCLYERCRLDSLYGAWVESTWVDPSFSGERRWVWYHTGHLHQFERPWSWPTGSHEFEKNTFLVWGTCMWLW